MSNMKYATFNGRLPGATYSAPFDATSPTPVVYPQEEQFFIGTYSGSKSANFRVVSPSTNNPTHLSTASLFLKIFVPDQNTHKCLQVSPFEQISVIKDTILATFTSELADLINYGLYIPPANGKNGKFLLEDRTLADYPTNTPTAYFEFRYKRRCYNQNEFSLSKLKKIHTKTNIRQFFEHVRSGDVERVTRWLNKGIDPNMHCKDSGETPLTLAAKREKPRELIMSLVSGGAHLDYRSSDSMTPLHKAAICGNYDAIKTFLDLGQSPNYRDCKGLTPLFYTVAYDTQANCTEKLLFDHSILGVADEHGLQEIHQACRYGRSQHLEQLLAYGADINATTKNGNTPLHICALTEQVACLKVLLVRGADRTRVNNNDQTAYEIAVISNHHEIATIIKEFTDEEIILLPQRTAYVVINDSPSYNAKRRPIAGQISQLSSTNNNTRSSSLSCLDDNGSSFVPGDYLQQSMFRPVSSPDPNCPTGVRYPPTSHTQTLHPNFHLFQHSDTNNSHQYRGDLRRSHSSLSSDESMLNSGTLPTTVPSHHLPRYKLTKPGIQHLSLKSSGVKKRPTMSPFLSTELPNYPRTIVLQKSSRGFGFVLRGATEPPADDFLPSTKTPARQYFEDIQPGSPADKAGLKSGDYVLEINGESVVCASHDHVVKLIRAAGDTLAMKVLTVDRSQIFENPAIRSMDTEIHVMNDIGSINHIPSHLSLASSSLNYPINYAGSNSETLSRRSIAQKLPLQSSKLGSVGSELSRSSEGDRSQLMSPQIHSRLSHSILSDHFSSIPESPFDLNQVSGARISHTMRPQLVNTQNRAPIPPVRAATLGRAGGVTVAGSIGPFSENWLHQSAEIGNEYIVGCNYKEDLDNKKWKNGKSGAPPTAGNHQINKYSPSFPPNYAQQQQLGKSSFDTMKVQQLATTNSNKISPQTIGQRMNTLPQPTLPTSQNSPQVRKSDHSKSTNSSSPSTTTAPNESHSTLNMTSQSSSSSVNSSRIVPMAPPKVPGSVGKQEGGGGGHIITVPQARESGVTRVEDAETGEQTVTVAQLLSARSALPADPNIPSSVVVPVTETNSHESQYFPLPPPPPPPENTATPDQIKDFPVIVPSQSTSTNQPGGSTSTGHSQLVNLSSSLTYIKPPTAPKIPTTNRAQTATDEVGNNIGASKSSNCVVLRRPAYNKPPIPEKPVRYTLRPRSDIDTTSNKKRENSLTKEGDVKDDIALSLAKSYSALYQRSEIPLQSTHITTPSKPETSAKTSSSTEVSTPAVSSISQTTSFENTRAYVEEMRRQFISPSDNNEKLSSTEDLLASRMPQLAQHSNNVKSDSGYETTTGSTIVTSEIVDSLSIHSCDPQNSDETTQNSAKSTGDGANKSAIKREPRADPV